MLGPQRGLQRDPAAIQQLLFRLERHCEHLYFSCWCYLWLVSINSVCVKKEQLYNKCKNCWIVVSSGRMHYSATFFSFSWNCSLHLITMFFCCISRNQMLCHLHKHSVWIIFQWLALAKQKAKEYSDLLLQGGESHLKPRLSCSEAFFSPCTLPLPLKCQRHLGDSSSQAFKLFPFSKIWTVVEWGHCQLV